jgi:hypothetical protein
MSTASTGRTHDCKRPRRQKAISRTRSAVRVLSCHAFRHKSVRLQLHALAYNIANFLRTLDRPCDVLTHLGCGCVIHLAAWCCN